MGKGGPNPFCFSINSPKKQLFLSCSELTERGEWIETLKLLEEGKIKEAMDKAADSQTPNKPKAVSQATQQKLLEKRQLRLSKIVMKSNLATFLDEQLADPSSSAFDADGDFSEFLKHSASFIITPGMSPPASSSSSPSSSANLLLSPRAGQRRSVMGLDPSLVEKEGEEKDDAKEKVKPEVDPNEDPDHGSIVVALCDYVGRSPFELSFRMFDEWKLIAKMSGGWWQGLLHGVTGYFPSSFVDIIEPPAPSSLSLSSRSSSSSQSKKKKKKKKLMEGKMKSLMESRDQEVMLMMESPRRMDRSTNRPNRRPPNSSRTTFVFLQSFLSPISLVFFSIMIKQMWS